MRKDLTYFYVVSVPRTARNFRVPLSICPSSWDTLLSCLLQFSCISHNDKLWKALTFLPSSLISHCLHKYCKLKVYFLAPDGQRAALNLKTGGWLVSLQSGLFPLVATCTNPYPDCTVPLPTCSPQLLLLKISSHIACCLGYLLLDKLTSLVTCFVLPLHFFKLLFSFNNDGVFLSLPLPTHC